MPDDVAPIANMMPNATTTQTDANPIVVELHGVSHRFAARVVFDGVSATMHSGQVAILSGRNGAGKSTLLRIVAGLLAPAEGKVRVEIDGSDLDSLARRSRMGYTAPDIALYRELSAAENLQFFARLRGIELNRERLIAGLTAVGLQGRGRDLVGSYSSGMRQRLKLAYALLGAPPILLLDEPTANLDRDGVAIVERIVAEQRVRPGGGLTILATNDPNEVAWGDLQVRLSANRAA